MTTGRIQVVEHAILIQEAMHDYEFRIVSSGIDTALVLVRDISERKAIERLKDEFVATVSHELRTPLTAIHGALGLVSGGVAGALPTQAHTMVEIALNNSDRLIRLINDLLDIQKIDAGQFDIQRSPLALLPLLERTIAANSAYGHQFGVAFRLECANTIVVSTDADRLMQVLTNLLSNAAKFSPAGDTVVVRVARYQQQVRIAVIDHGPGIPLAFQAKLFHKFAQADGSNTRRSGGTGLGLSIAKKLIERLGGRIGFETAAGVGTTFYVELPEWQNQVDVQALDQVSH
jgi:signal transduction histidine kinase